MPVGSSISAGWKSSESGRENKEGKKTEMPKSARASPRIKAMRGWMENEDVVHELLLDPEFRMKEQDEPALPTVEALEKDSATPRYLNQTQSSSGSKAESLEFALSPSASSTPQPGQTSGPKVVSFRQGGGGGAAVVVVVVVVVEGVELPQCLTLLPLLKNQSPRSPLFRPSFNQRNLMKSLKQDFEKQ